MNNVDANDFNFARIKTSFHKNKKQRILRIIEAFIDDCKLLKSPQIYQRDLRMNRTTSYNDS